MRTLRTTVAFLGATALLAVSAMTTTAEETTGCTGLLEFSDEGMTWESTDPRLSGEASESGGWSLYETPSEDAGTPLEGDASYIIINEDGTWSCSDSKPAGPEPDLTGHTLVFTGTGDYEGLTAHVRIDWTTYPFTFSGIIIEGGQPEDTTLRG